MHVVIWTSKGQRYATPSSAVVEVISVVQSRPMSGAQTWLIGLFDYRGELLPLFDSSRLLGYDESTVRMSGRVLVVRSGEVTDENSRRVGLLVENVLGAEQLEFDEESGLRAACAGVEFLGPVALTPNGTVQLTTPARLPQL